MKASKARPVNTSRTVLVVGGGIVIASLATFGVLYAVGMLAVGSRQAIVRDRGAQVMPFDLDQTTHIFTPTGTGGVEKVIVKDSNDAEQIRMIQDHLEHEAAQFSNGDFADPAAIHGERMPGLAELRAGAADIQFRYSPLPNGAQITYTAQDGRLIQAIHDWLAAQLADHGHDAMSH